MRQYLSPQFFLSLNPKIPDSMIGTYLILFIFVIILGTVVSSMFKKKSLLSKPYIKMQEKVFYQSWIIGVCGLILTFFAWQEIPYLSAPILIYTLIIIFIYLIIYDIVFYYKVIKNEVLLHQQDMRYKKYLPKNKKQFK
jgi:uncharacterized protein YacL